MFSSIEETQLFWFSALGFILICIFRLSCQKVFHNDSTCRTPSRRRFSDPNTNGKLPCGHGDGFGRSYTSNRRGRRPISLRHI